ALTRYEHIMPGRQEPGALLRVGLGTAREIAVCDAGAQGSATRSSALAWAITVLLFASMVVNFVDRLVLASLAPILRSELHLSNTQYSYIVLAFMTGMTIGQLPAGMFVDAIGARLALPALLSGWSAANILQALARGVVAFSGLRFLMGLCECGNY